MVDIHLPNNWRPRDYQMPAWQALMSGKRFLSLICHRRWGKDDLCLHWGAIAAHQRRATYWHMLPQYGQARKAVWEAVNPHTGLRRIDEAFPKALRKRTLDQTMTIEFKNGSFWHLVGSDNYNSYVGSPPAGVTISEWAIADPASWGYIRPILDENKGWAAFITTPRGRNHAYRLHRSAMENPDWFAMHSSCEDTGIFDNESLDKIRKEYIDLYGRDYGEALFRQEYYCDWESSQLGSVYGDLMREAWHDKRIRDVPHDKSLKVETWWDIGHRDALAIWFIQRGVGGEIRAIDYLEAVGRDQPWALAELQRLQQERGYVYGRHLGPPDMRVHEYGAGKTRLEQAEDLGFEFDVCPPVRKVADRINAARMLIPKTFFDKRRCARGIEALEAYHYRYNEDTRILTSDPEHDWSSHGCDSFGYGAYAVPPIDTRFMDGPQYQPISIA